MPKKLCMALGRQNKWRASIQKRCVGHSNGAKSRLEDKAIYVYLTRINVLQFIYESTYFNKWSIKLVSFCRTGATYSIIYPMFKNK